MAWQRLGHVRMVPLLLVVAAATGCATTVTGKKVTDYGAGTVLILPPRDVVQGGVPHAKGVGSGKIFLDYVTGAFQTTGFKVVTTRNPSFDGTRIASREEALAEGKALGTDYVLVLVLGEFLDAAPMTFRADSVTLQQAVMMGTASGNDVWRLDKPTTFQKTNIGVYTPLLDEMAQSLVKAIAGGP